MIFPSHIFLLVFLPLALAGWYGLRGTGARLTLITVASYCFYGWWDWRFTILLFASSWFDYQCGIRIARARLASGSGTTAGQIWLVLSLSGNLLVLAFFKYAGFLAQSANAVCVALGGAEVVPVMDIALPIGISFYTFQTMSYTIDLYRGKCGPARNFLHFAAFVSLFPQLVAGPIVRYSDLEDQFSALPGKRFSYDDAADGIWLFVLGLVKKVWIADIFAPVATLAFDAEGSVQFFTAWAGALAYTLQLYFDFSGYSDMARGLGKLLGFDFPINFNSPYKSRSIAEFWNRWHMTLSSWLRDYLYIPLGGSRCGTLKTIRNLFLVMLLGGLWHGAAWNFVLWGVYHGLLLALHAAWRHADPRRLPAWFAVPGTMLLVVAGWVLFRAATVGQAMDVYAAMLGLHGVEPLTHYSQTLGLYLPALYGAFGGMHGVAVLVGAMALVLCAPNSQALPRFRHPAIAAVLSAIVVMTITTLRTEAPFLYYQF